eukprot:6158192-Amphidinium_carterae.1
MLLSTCIVATAYRCILVQRAVSKALGVTGACGLPPDCGHAVDMLHAFLPRSIRCAGRQVEVRKQLRQALASLTSVNMRVNALKTVVLCNGSVTKRKLWKVWRACRLPLVQMTTRDLGVDTQWFAWENLVQQQSVHEFDACVRASSAHDDGQDCHTPLQCSSMALDFSG